MAKITIEGNINTQKDFEAYRKKIKDLTENQNEKKVDIFFKGTQYISSSFAGYLSFINNVRKVEVTLHADDKELFETLQELGISLRMKVVRE